MIVFSFCTFYVHVVALKKKVNIVSCCSRLPSFCPECCIYYLNLDERSKEDKKLITWTILPNHPAHKNYRSQLRLRTDLLFSGFLHRKIGSPAFSLICAPLWMSTLVALNPSKCLSRKENSNIVKEWKATYPGN